jgi:hypothetical protein
MRARDLASQAAKEAKQVAAQASREADRLAKQAQDRAATAERQVTQANKAGQTADKATKPAAAGPANVTLHEGRYLDALTKEQLLHLTGDLELQGQSTMSKHELIDALTREGGVPIGTLSKDELLRVARGAGREVDTSMTKDELIAAIDIS